MRDLGSNEAGAAEARIVGNLAGVVEWANDAFARLSGIALDETVDKPVGRLLERAGVELEIVDFVAQHFFEGEICRVAFPFERPDGRRIDVVLEVEALRDAVGEIDRFMAIAREAPKEVLAPPPAPRPTTARMTTARGGAPMQEIELNDAVRRGLETALDVRAGATATARRACEGALESSPGSSADSSSDSSSDSPPDSSLDSSLAFAVELDLERDLGPVRVASDDVAALVTALFDAARLAIEESGNAGGVVTISTARLAAHRRFVSKVHAVAACPPERSAAGDVVLEVHDTAVALGPSLVAALARGEVGSTSMDAASAHVRALAEACARARALGARVHLDATPGCGNQLLVLFTAAQAR